MRIAPVVIASLLLVFALSHTWAEGLAAGTPADTPILVWAPVADQGTLQQNNNTTPSFSDLVPIIIFVLVGVGIAIVVVAVGLWISGRRRRERGQAGGKPASGEGGEKGEDEEWGASWKPPE